MENKEALAREIFQSGANCAQAVFCSFADEFGFTRAEAMKLASGFGAGVGRMREVCGAFSALVMISNLRHGPESAQDKAGKDLQYQKIQHLAEKFKQQSGGSIICRELLNLSKQGAFDPVSEKRTAEYYQKRPCIELVGLAAKLAEEDIQV